MLNLAALKFHELDLARQSGNVLSQLCQIGRVFGCGGVGFGHWIGSLHLILATVKRSPEPDCGVTGDRHQGDFHRFPFHGDKLIATALKLVDLIADRNIAEYSSFHIGAALLGLRARSPAGHGATLAAHDLSPLDHTQQGARIMVPQQRGAILQAGQVNGAMGMGKHLLAPGSRYRCLTAETETDRVGAGGGDGE